MVVAVHVVVGVVGGCGGENGGRTLLLLLHVALMGRRGMPNFRCARRLVAFLLSSTSGGS